MAATEEDVTVKIAVAKSKPSENPIVLSFPGGFAEPSGGHSDGNDDDSHDDDERNPPTFFWQKLNSQQKFKSGRRVVGYDSSCLYSASAEGLGFDDRLTKICVGVYDKRKGTLTLHEGATRGTVFVMQQSVPTYLEQNNRLLQETNPGSNNRPNVFEDFGSSKKRKVLKSQAANRVEIDHVIGAGSGSAMVQHIMKGQQMSESNKKAIEESKQSDTDRKSAGQLALEAARRQLLPAYDEQAIEPQKVYDAKDIAGDKAWDRIYNKVHACLHQENPTFAVIESIFENDRNDFIVKMIEEVEPDSRNAAFRITCAILANWMIKFYKSNHFRKSIDGVNEIKASWFGIPSEIAYRCIQLFATPLPGGSKSEGTFVMSKQNKEKNIVHILLLCMIARGSSMSIPTINPIAECLQVPVKDCCQLLKYAGCTISKSGDVYAAKLKTPLEFPTMSRGPRIPRGR